MDEVENATSLDNGSFSEPECSLENESDVENESPNPKSEYSHLYKTCRFPTTQEERRVRLLEKQKERRQHVISEKRGILEAAEDSSEDECELAEQMQVELAAKKPRRRKFRQRLMFSEWFAEIPDDLESKWLVKLCPLGTQSLVVAQNGCTKVYNKSGVLKAQFQSEFPGGSRKYSRDRKVCTILHCIYNRQLQVYFVLDIITWNSQYIKYSEAEFRFYWLRTKEDEDLPCFRDESTSKKPSFYGIDCFPADRQLIQEKLSEPHKVNDMEVALDGVLFYHREAHYAGGYTPLVGWLKPYMVPEMLGIPVNDCYMMDMPENYDGLKEFLERKRSRVKNKQKTETQTEEFMDV